MAARRERYLALLDEVSKPGRYLGNEPGAVRKDPDTVSLRFALAFPEVYEVAQSHLGLQILYDVLNARPDVYAERVYAPWFDMESAMRRAGLPLVSLETFTPLREFHIVGFSLQYELTYTNVLAMLDLGGIPLHAADRRDGDPLVIAGGPCASNPEPLAEFLDAVLLGDGEEAIGEICDCYLHWRGKGRRKLLAALGAIPGVYVPAQFEPVYRPDGTLAAVRPLGPQARVTKRVVADLDRVPRRRTYVVPNVQIVHDRPSIEVMRGCVKGCRFCQAGYFYRPLRERDPREVVAAAEEAIRLTGADELSLLSLSTGDYSCVNPVLTVLMDQFAPQRVAISLPSTRVEALALPLLEQIRRVRKTGFTLAPEAGTERMRRIIQKEYTEEELLAAARRIYELGWRSLKLYFMIGLPGETEADVVGIAELSERVAAMGGPSWQVTASVSTFVPKPHTPFQWAAQISIEEIRARQDALRRALAHRRVRLRWHDARESFLEGIFSRGDRRLGRLVERAFRLGCRFDGWTEALRFDLWERALRECDVDPAFYLRRRRLDEVLPWDHLDCGVSKGFLQRELARAFEGLWTPDCSVGRCTYCGACDFREIRNVTYHPSGAKGGEHRGSRIARWAEESMGQAGAEGWETLAWRRARGGGFFMQSAAAMAASGTDSRSLARSAGSRPESDAAEGPADAWLDARWSGLVPSACPTAAPRRMRLRLRCAKLDCARFLGHLELAGVFHRACRRAGLPLAFSAGHHPLPRLAFGPALPLGTESECEFVDLDLSTLVDPDAVRERLSKELPEGLELREVRPLPLNAPSLESEIRGFRYRVSGEGIGPGAAAQIAAFWKGAAFPLRKHSRGGDKIVDARPFVWELALVAPGCIETAIAFGVAGTIKPAHLVGALLGLPERSWARLRVRKIETLFRTDPSGGTIRDTAGTADATFPLLEAPPAMR